MAYKQPSSGSTFKMMGSSPVKQAHEMVHSEIKNTNVSKQKMKALEKKMAPGPNSKPMQRVERPKSKMLKNFSDLTPAEIKAMKLDKPYNTLAPKKPAPTKQSKSHDTNTEYLNEMKTYGKRPTASAETKDYYEGQTKKTSVSGKVRALVKSYTGGESYKKEKKKQRQSAHTKGKKAPSDLETLKYIKKQPSTGRKSPQR